MTYLLQQLVNGLALGTTYALIAISFVLVFGVMRVLNAALGGLVVLGAYTAWFVSDRIGSNLLLAMAIAIVVVIVAGAIIERVAIAPVRNRNALAPFLTTLGASMFIEGLLRTVFDAQPKALAVDFPSGVIRVAGVTVGLRQLTIIGIALTLMLGIGYVVSRTKGGRQLRAVAENPEMAMSLAVDARRIRVIAVTVASALAAITGVLLGISFGAITPTLGLGLTLKGLIVLIVGGMTSFRGAAIVGMALGIMEVFATAFAPSLPRDALVYLVLIAVLLARPAGLFGRRVALAQQGGGVV